MCVFTNLSSKVLADSKRLNRRVVCLRFVAPSRRQPDRYFSLSLFPFLTIHLVCYFFPLSSFILRENNGRGERDVSIFRASFKIHLIRGSLFFFFFLIESRRFVLEKKDEKGGEGLIG